VDESVVVSAGDVDTPLSRTSDSVTVIDRQTLVDRQLTSVADAVRLAPGFNVVQSGGPGSVTSFFPRGGESDYTEVLVDGIPQNVFGGGFDAGHLSTADVERIEVVRGPESAVYGSGAIGGLIQVITRHGGPLRGTASFESGGYGTRTSQASAAGSHGDWTWGAGADWQRSDGDTRVRANLGGARVSNADYDRASGSGSLGWSDRPSRRIRVDVRGGRNEVGNPGPYGSDPLGFYGGIDTVSRGINRTREASVSGVFGDRGPVAHRVQVTWAQYLSHYISQFSPSDDDARRLTARYQIDIEREHLGVSAGGELLREQSDNTFVQDADSQPLPVRRNASALFVEARPVLSSRVFVQAGARLERIERAPLAADAFGSRPMLDNDIVWSANPKVSVAWIARRAGAGARLGSTTLRGSAGTGIKPPTVFEIAFTNNPDLKPERNRSVDFGVEQPFAGGAAALSATVFHNDYDDLIVAVGQSLQDAGVSRYTTDNVSNARAQGLELGLTVRPRRSLVARAGWTWLDTDVLGIDRAPDAAPLPYVVGDPLVRRPRHQASFDLTWSGGRGSAFLAVNGRGRMLDLEPNLGAGACFGAAASCRAVFTNPAYVTTSTGGSVRIGGGAELFARVTNLFNREYEEVLGYPALGRSASVGIRIARGR
jgi:outer membrane cobalamin receptor